MKRSRAQAAIKQPSAAARRLKGQAAIKSRSATTGTLHAQAAMEFLMTYGWAILIMLVVIAVLFYLGVFSPTTSTTKSCVLPAGLSCYEFDIDDSGSITLDLGQATGKAITVYGVGCGVNSSPALTSLPAPVTIQSGTHAKVTGPSAGVAISCSGASGSQFKGKIAIKYSPGGSSYNKTVYEDISGPLMNATSGGGGSTDTGGVWVLVPGNPSFGTSDFYVMKYEAKQNSTNATSTAAGNPWASITQTSARTACTNIGAHLLTIAEAQTINRDVASVGSNWMSGSVGNGCMYGGHMECDGAPCDMAFNASSNDAEGWWNGTSASYNPAVQHCPFTASEDRGNETRRTMYLSNGNVLWDWSGNVFEWMNDTCLQGGGAGYWYDSASAWLPWTDANLQDYERTTMGPPSASWSWNNGVGRYVGCYLNGSGLIHGDWWGRGQYAGAFSLSMDTPLGYSSTSVGFRCAR